MRKIKIAMILPSFDIGGTEHMAACLAQGLDKSRFELLVISLAGPRKNHVQERMEASGAALFYGGKGEGSAWKVFFKVYRCLADFRPDLIHSHMYAFAFAAPYVLTHPVRLLHTVHNKPSREFKRKYQILISLLYRRQKAIPVAISHTVEKELREMYPGLKDTERIYNPVDTEKYAVNREVKAGQDITFVHVARMMRQKNQALLLEAFAQARKQIPGLRLVMVGDGELRGELHRRADKEDLRGSVAFAGNVGNVRDYLAQGDVFVLSSDYEGLPLSILEAMAAGLPILATDVGGVRDIVTDNGFLIPPGDQKDLAERMVFLARHPEERERMGRQSAVNVRPYDCAEFIKKYERLYMYYALPHKRDNRG